ncbi:MAG: metalloprotease PmbA [Moraxellaceae bacterium]|nr:MAG: metalloprotease PmbA [Moraxellaceae bacterium]
MIVDDELNKLQTCIGEAMEEAHRLGATQAEVAASSGEGLAVNVRNGDVDTVEFTKHNGFAITVYRGQSKGSSSTSDLSSMAIRRAVAAALDIAHYTADDEYSGLATADAMATRVPDLDLYHPWDINSADAIELALSCEKAGLAFHDGIKKSDGVGVNSSQSVRFYGNSHGFSAGVAGTHHSISCGMIANDDEGMERSHWYSGSRLSSELELPAMIGEKAAERAMSRLGGRKISTCEVPVLYSAEVAGSLIGHLVGAVSGGNLYRKSSFLMDALNNQVMSSVVSVYERPLLLQGSASSGFDGDGLATYDKNIVTDGILESYILGSYSARRLGLASTANGGGVRNLRTSNTGQNFAELLRDMGSGLLVTSLMGQGANLLTGDYSRGAEGFWIENGEIQFPVKEVTIAGNLADIFKQIVAIGTDTDCRGNVQVGSMLVENMKVAGA